MCLSTCGVCTCVFVCAVFVILVPEHFWSLYVRAVHTPMVRERPKAEFTDRVGIPCWRTKAERNCKAPSSAKKCIFAQTRLRASSCCHWSEPSCPALFLKQCRDKKPHLPPVLAAVPSKTHYYSLCPVEMLSSGSAQHGASFLLEDQSRVLWSN